MDTGPQEHHSRFRVLYLEDDLHAARALIRAISPLLIDHDIHHVETELQTVERMRNARPELIIVDLSLTEDEPPERGIVRISDFLSRDPTVQIIALTGHGSEELTIQALDSGAFTFLNKPADPTQLAALIRDRTRISQIHRRAQLFKANSTLPGMLGDSGKMRTVLAAAEAATSHRLPILILGETGTGKSALARAIHEGSKLRKKPFVRYAPTLASNDLVLSELFGHTKGAFTGASEARRGLIEEASGGTLFLDELAEIPEASQIMLLEALQSKQFRRLGSNVEQFSDFRFLTASNLPLEELSRRLRKDFLHRASHLRIEIPPLRERQEDIPVLARSFLNDYCAQSKIMNLQISQSAVLQLLNYSWPGNVRELQAAVQSAAAQAHFLRRPIISSAHFSERISEISLNALPKFRDRVSHFELSLVRSTLAACNGNQVQAAALLQMDRSSLRRILLRATTTHSLPGIPDGASVWGSDAQNLPIGAQTEGARSSTAQQLQLLEQERGMRRAARRKNRQQ